VSCRENDESGRSSSCSACAAAGVKVLNEPAMQDSLTKLGVEALPMTPAQMDDLVRRETAANMEVIEAAGIRQ